ncbi:MAG: multicopper oxidase domain-containing protein [Gemmatimonadota bacterium]
MLVIALVRSLVLASTVLANNTAPDCRSLPDPKAPPAIPNDNRVAAGKAKDGILTVRLVARPAAWHPEGNNGCGIRVHAFAEEGKPTQIPGPVLRVRVGTEVRVILRNELGLNLKIRGLYERKAETVGAELARQSIDASAVEIAPGESREIRFRATVPGNFYYWGITPIDTIAAYPFRQPGAPMPLFSPFEDSQLVGALIVDPAEGSPADRIFVLTHWRLAGSDPDEAGRRQINGINGLSWPHTEQLSATVGDALRWRVVNAAGAPHTMHLHGFYFRVLSQGGLSAFDSILPPPQHRTVVSEFMPGSRTITMEWVPEREGNWLFHCHWIAHMGPAQRIERVFDANSTTSNAHTQHAGHDMAGLVVGIAVKSAGTTVASKASTPARQLRLYASERPRVFGPDPGLGFVVQEGSTAPARDSIRIPGTPIILTKGEPTQITVFNRLRIPLAVHWHGLELESYYDGVPDFSGSPGRTAPAIAPGDSFVVHITPPRAGTFLYHIHSEEANELNSGLYGSLIVLDPAKGRDPIADRTFVISAGGRGRTANQTIFVNGTTKPDGLDMSVGSTQRWRFIVIAANGTFDVRINGKTPSTWRQIARDGADLPTQQIVEGPAQARIAVGVTMDFEVTPTAAGEFSLQVDLPRGPAGVAGFATTVPIRVQSTAPGSSASQVRNQPIRTEDREVLERALEMLADDPKWNQYSNVSDLLWTLICTIQKESPELFGARPRVNPGDVCVELQELVVTVGAESSVVRARNQSTTVEDAKNLVRLALSRPKLH